MRSLAFVLTAVVFALIGSQIPQFTATKVPHQNQQCADDNCKVIVKITSDWLSPQIYVDYELTEARRHHVNFELDDAATPRYEFPDNGIVFASGFSCQKTGKKFKVNMTQIYWTLGHHDLVAIMEAPDDESATAFALAVGAAGNVRTQTLRAFSKEEMNGILAKMA